MQMQKVASIIALLCVCFVGCVKDGISPAKYYQLDGQTLYWVESITGRSHKIHKQEDTWTTAGNLIVSADDLQWSLASIDSTIAFGGDYYVIPTRSYIMSTWHDYRGWLMRQGIKPEDVGNGFDGGQYAHSFLAYLWFRHKAYYRGTFNAPEGPACMVVYVDYRGLSIEALILCYGVAGNVIQPWLYSPWYNEEIPMSDIAGFEAVLSRGKNERIK